MKKQAFLVLLMSALLVTGCTNNQSVSPSDSNEPDQSSIEEQPFSNQTGTSSQNVPSSPAGQSSKPSSSSAPSQASSMKPYSYGPSSGVALSLASPNNDIHTDLQYSYLKDPDWRNVKAYIPSVNAEDYRTHDDVGKARALELEFDDVGDASTYYVQVAKDNAFTNAPILTTTKKSYELLNSEINVKYYYRAATSQDALTNASVKEYIVTDLAPRNLKVDGVLNFRDVGGWKSSLVPNGVVKQGLYYRCGQFNSITTAGLAEIKRLNIKVDIDMRDSVPSTSPLKSSDYNVDILPASIPSGTERQRFVGFADVYKKIFDAIAVADEKPIALHCTHGADRTGITSFFLLALLGVSVEDCGRDYCFTRFAGQRAVLPAAEFDGWVNSTIALQGETFADKMFNHLLSKGISADTLETIREKFIPGYQRKA